MTIIEQTIVAKNLQKRSEDGIVTTADFVAVIDGSTSKSQRRCHRSMSLVQRSNGETAMLTIASYIRKMPKNSSCHQFCLGATQAIRQRYKKSLLEHLAQHPEDRLTASCIVYSRLRRELWFIGDCQALVIGNTQPPHPTYYDNPKPYEQELAQMRADIIKASPQPWSHFLDEDTARQAIIPRMLETMQQQNKTYSVIDGFPVDESHVRVITLDFQPWQLVLATDGYPFLCPTLKESEERLEEQRQQDPLNIGPRFMATKAFAHGNNSFDDRAYIRFDI
jgi:glycerophosphoryl diester phosphodiesterase